MRRRAELLAPIQNSHTQYNLPELQKKPAYKTNREGIEESFQDPSARRSVELDLAFADFYDERLRELELYLTRSAKADDAQSFYLLRSLPGVGKILALIILYEVHDINRFARPGDFLSYSRLVKCERASAGKVYGSSGKKIGNAHLKWAFSEAACLFLRNNPDAQKLYSRLERKHGKGKALTVLAHKLARAVWYMLKRKTPFDQGTFLGTTISQSRPANNCPGGRRKQPRSPASSLVKGTKRTMTEP